MRRNPFHSSRVRTTTVKRHGGKPAGPVPLYLDPQRQASGQYEKKPLPVSEPGAGGETVFSNSSLRSVVVDSVENGPCSKCFCIFLV
jgi:hypothetical protein